MGVSGHGRQPIKGEGELVRLESDALAAACPAGCLLLRAPCVWCAVSLRGCLTDWLSELVPRVSKPTSQRANNAT